MTIEEKKNKCLEFIKSRKSLTYLGLEREAGIPEQTLTNCFRKDGEPFPLKHLDKLVKILEHYGFKLDEKI